MTADSDWKRARSRYAMAGRNVFDSGENRIDIRTIAEIEIVYI
jgi:hypothetical protein